MVACAGRGGSLGAVGESHVAPHGGSDKDLDGGPIDGGGRAALPRDYRATFTKINKARFVSQGHAAGRWEVDVWANELAAKAIASRARTTPVGATVVEEHFERGGGAQPGGDEARRAGPVMVMEKRPAGFSAEHGDWRWVVVGSQGQLVKDGVIDTCAGCHDDAPMDGLFPLAN